MSDYETARGAASLVTPGEWYVWRDTENETVRLLSRTHGNITPALPLARQTVADLEAAAAAVNLLRKQLTGGQRITMSSNEHPDMSGSGCDEDYYSVDEVSEKQHEAFVVGAQQMREMLARFVEQGGTDAEKAIAQSVRLNWVPGWGFDPGKPDDVHNAIDMALP